MPGGRPTSYDPSYCKMLMEHMQDGYSFESFAGKVGVCFKTLYNWEKEFPEFLQAKGTGRAMSLLHWEEKVMDSLPNGITNASVLSLAMRNLHNWRMKDDTQINVGGTSDEKNEKLVIKFSGAEDGEDE